MAIGLGAAGCAAELGLPPPAPAAIEPGEGFTSEDVPVLIHGDAFYVRASQSMDGAGGDRASVGFRAWLGDVELRDVARLDATTLTAVVPAGIGLGVHALAVEGPTGSGALADAYRAISGTSPVLTVELSAVTSVVTVGDVAQISVRVTNEGPGALASVAVSLKRVTNGSAGGPNLPGAPAPQDLEAGQFFAAVFDVSTSAPGALEFEAKASGTPRGTDARVAAVKSRVQIEVVAPAAVLP